MASAKGPGTANGLCRADPVCADETVGAAVIGEKGTGLPLGGRQGTGGCRALVDVVEDVDAGEPRTTLANECGAGIHGDLTVKCNAAVTGLCGWCAQRAAILKLDADIAKRAFVAVGAFFWLTRNETRHVRTAAFAGLRSRRFRHNAGSDVIAGRILDLIDAAARHATRQSGFAAIARFVSWCQAPPDVARRTQGRRNNTGPRREGFGTLESFDARMPRGTTPSNDEREAGVAERGGGLAGAAAEGAWQFRVILLRHTHETSAAIRGGFARDRFAFTLTLTLTVTGLRRWVARRERQQTRDSGIESQHWGLIG